MAMFSRRIFVSGSAASMGGLVLSRACPAWAALQESTKATLQMGWIANVENAGEFVAADKGYYTDAGLDLELTPGGPGISVEPLVVAGTALVGLSQPDNVARAREQGAKIKVVATTFQRNPAAVMSLASNPVPTPQDLVGKKLGIQQSGVPIYDAFFTSISVDPKEIEYVPVQFDPAPLVSGEVDAFVSFQTNQPIQLAQQGIETVTFLLADYGFNLFTDSFVVAEESLANEDKRSTILKILDATFRGWKDAIADPEMAARLVVENYGKSLNLDLDAQILTLKAQIPLIVTDETQANGLGTMSDDGIQTNIETLGRSGIEATAEDIFDTSLLAELTPVIVEATPVASPAASPASM
jgi:ABC-type nitrate/sulfonate/bicarbonate transport system substrate-binding protein